MVYTLARRALQVIPPPPHIVLIQFLDFFYTIFMDRVLAKTPTLTYPPLLSALSVNNAPLHLSLVLSVC